MRQYQRVRDDSEESKRDLELDDAGEDDDEAMSYREFALSHRTAILRESLDGCNVPRIGEGKPNSNFSSLGPLIGRNVSQPFSRSVSAVGPERLICDYWFDLDPHHIAARRQTRLDRLNERLRKRRKVLCVTAFLLLVRGHAMICDSRILDLSLVHRVIRLFAAFVA